MAKKSGRKATRKKGTLKKGKAPAGPASGGGGLRLEVWTGEKLKTCAHPENWRGHGASQRRIYRGVRDEVGFVGYVLFNAKTGRLLDGHMRVEEAAADDELPVLVGEWDARQERVILASHDPIAGMAGIDAGQAAALLAEIETDSPEVHALLEGLEAAVNKLLEAPAPGSPENGPGSASEGTSGGEPDEPAQKEREAVHRLMMGFNSRHERDEMMHLMRRAGVDAQALDA